MHVRIVRVGLAGLLWASSVALLRAETSPDRPPFEEGTIAFQPHSGATSVPERYRLPAHSFAYTLERKRELANSAVEIYQLRFPSPVVSDCPENNTVYAEYYRPKGSGPFP